MGRIKTKIIKRITNKLIKRYSNDFKTDFESNKQLVNNLLENDSKKFRNIIAGYITRIKRKEAVKQQ